jgi:hypothetical protein
MQNSIRAVALIAGVLFAVRAQAVPAPSPAFGNRLSIKPSLTPGSVSIPTQMAFGPDGRLYVARAESEIISFAYNPTTKLLSDQRGTGVSAALTAGLFTHNWHWLGGIPLDYFFIGLACVAVYFSAKKTLSPYLKTGMWICVIIFAVALLSHEVSVYAQYVSIAASIGLMVLHFVNIRYCKRCSVQKVNA